ncbi:MAG: 50S ribosomal protein L6 [Candidatus Micrarchaeia archaeon]
MKSLEIPENVKVDIKDNEIIVNGKLGTNIRKFNNSLVNITKEENKLIIKSIENNSKLKKKGIMVENAIAKELNNDIKGVNNYFEINMQTVFAHFPITIEAKNNQIFIKNIIGERAPRISMVSGNTKVEIKGQNVRLYGTKLDDVMQTAANLKKACRIRKKDNRVFQDGVYMIQQ